MAIDALLASAGGNKTVLGHEIAPSWIASPGFRGTSDILWSCLVTLTACVYTALHLNIPATHKTQWQRIRTKLRWVSIAVLGPELVLISAIDQWRSARELCRALQSLDTEQASETGEEGRASKVRSRL